MKAKFISFLSVVILTISIIHAQQFEGIATYKSKRGIKSIKMDSTQISDPGLQSKINAMIAKNFEKTYQLKFNKSESIYSEVKDESLDRPNVSGNNQEFMVVNLDATEVLYKNMKNEKTLRQSEVSGKQFLIEGSLDKQDWEFHSDTKTIGNYTCSKATKKSTFIEYSAVNGKKVGTEKERTTTVWYTTEIPVNTGPGYHYGLPGLILEVNDGATTLICSEIVLNPKEGVLIEKPKKGKKITNEEFSKLEQKRLEELMDRRSRKSIDSYRVIGG